MLSKILLYLSKNILTKTLKYYIVDFKMNLNLLIFYLLFVLLVLAHLYTSSKHIRVNKMTVFSIVGVHFPTRSNSYMCCAKTPQYCALFIIV